jgi:hypothetical protein
MFKARMFDQPLEFFKTMQITLGCTDLYLYCTFISNNYVNAFVVYKINILPALLSAELGG